jgi:hypothetical protein
MEATSSFEMPVDFQRTTRRYMHSLFRSGTGTGSCQRVIYGRKCQVNLSVTSIQLAVCSKRLPNKQVYIHVQMNRMITAAAFRMCIDITSFHLYVVDKTH